MECDITNKLSTSGNTMFNAALERIHRVIENLVRVLNISTQTYVDKNDPWTGNLDAAAFAIISTTNGKKFTVQAN